jgi:2-polyprenyl-6-methoxyphenol hydroxylase-like FAD-dependent oxidoreductase
MLTLFGMLGDHPPKDRDGFDAFARSLRFPDLHDAVAGAEPLGPPAAYRFQANIRRRYERMRRLPDGFLVIGDALCSLNPIYGQGMTVAALQALALRDELSARAAPRRVLRALARVTDGPWEMALGADLAVPGVEGRRTVRRRLAGAYVTRLQAAAARDPGVARAFVRATGLVDRPQALLRPAVALRVLRPSAGSRTAPRRGAATAAQQR